MKPHNAHHELEVSYNKAEEKVALPSKKKKKTKKRKNYTGSTRNRNLHIRFKELPDDETLIDYFVCSLAQDFLPLQGKLYLTRNYFAFYSNYIGLVNRILIPITTIKHISKEKTSKLFVNTISITVTQPQQTFSIPDKSINDNTNDNNDTTNNGHSNLNGSNDGVHVFVNLISHDAAFTLMNSLWKGPSLDYNVAVFNQIDNQHENIELVGNESDGYTSDESSKVSSELTSSVGDSKEDLKKDLLTGIHAKIDQLFEQHREAEEKEVEKNKIGANRVSKVEWVMSLAKVVAYKVYNFLDFVLPSGPHVIYSGLCIMVVLMISTLYLVVRIIHVEERLLSVPIRKIQV